MGCVHSRVEREEAVRRCKERRKLMKQLLSLRAELAAAHMAYLQSLRNTGATLRQFTEAESVVPIDAPHGLSLPPPPPPPPPPLPPSPPPPPHVGPSMKKEEIEEEPGGKDSIDSEDNDSCMTPPLPPLRNSAWDFWDPFGLPDSSNSPSPVPQKENGGAIAGAPAEEEDWAETISEFGEEEGEGEVEKKNGADGEIVTVNPAKEESAVKELADDNSSAVSWYTKDSEMAMVVWRSKKTLVGIVKELDDYFLKAAAGGKDVAVLLESNRGHCVPWDFDERKGKSSKSAKVFNALSWSWSFRYLHSNTDACVQDTSDAPRPGYHCTTLEKIYAEEQRLYKAVKEEETAKVQHKKKTLLLQKLEAGDQDWTKTERIQLDIEELQCRITSLQESINGTCLSISKLRDEELHSQLIELSLGLVQMWRTMYECHQVQNHVAQQANLLDNRPGSEPTTDSLRHATFQLETEVTSWYSSFCNLLKSQREYMHILNQWVRLTDCLPDNNGPMGSTCGIHTLCEEWQRAFDRLPDKVAAEAIKSFLSVVHSIVQQQNEERNLKKKADRLENRLQKELYSLHDSEKSNEHTIGDQAQELNHHPSLVKQAKLYDFKKRVEEEKAKYLNSVRMSRAMTLNNLQTSLPNVFQALTGFASICVQAFEGINRSSEAATSNSEAVSPLCPPF